MQFCRLRDFALGFTKVLTQPRLPLSLIHRRFLATDAKLKKKRFPWMQWGFFFACTGAVAYFSMYAVTSGKETMQKISSNFGQIAIGGDFRLRDQTGMEVTLADFKGKWVLVYFGFCRCPDICPEQLERLVEVQERLALYGKDKDFVPIFITVDPERDTPEVVGEYVKEFSPKLVGLTGSPEQIQVTAKRYRIYYSKGPPDCDGDYIVDHTVVMYLLNPMGEFVEFYGQVKPVQEIVRRIMDHMKKYME
ncbi:SCO cytochrome oxidase deficient protein 1 [Echinococcus multilocularis]|uniref:SCO cytochrome oxidase deficient protein 1 n=1 Tax=Echinococcus multilocularis TaxID=6211 RepID=A0A087W1E7_ECHMU|nr:SCO cytochrome oxidase deficient protein 1 [Echinococcus multilocularis]